MFSQVEQVKADILMHFMGDRYRAGHAKQAPIGDRMINAVRSAIWDAWERGLDHPAESYYPTFPLLDRGPHEPEI